MKLGYIRVSTIKQQDEGTSLTHQKTELMDAGVERIYEDTATGKNANRPGLTALMDAARPGDEILITRLDRLGRNTADMLSITQQWKDNDISLTVIEQGINTSGPTGTLVLTIMSSIAQFERTQILERTAAGRAAAIEQGKTWKRGTTWTPKQARKACRLVEEKHISKIAAGKIMGVSARTIGRMITAAHQQDNK